MTPPLWLWALIGWTAVIGLFVLFWLLAKLIATQPEVTGPCQERTYLDDAACQKPAGHLGYHEAVDSLGHILWP